MSERQKQAQRAARGGCPVCGSNAVEGEGVDINGSQAGQECSCLVCDAVWTNRYNWSSFTLHDGGDT